MKGKSELNLINQNETRLFFKCEKPQVVICAAAKVGGIYANEKYSGQFLYENLAIQNNVIHFSHEFKVNQLMFLGSACIYPKYAKQPIEEKSLLSGHLEPTNEAYAIAKIAGLKLCESYYRQYSNNFISVMPNNLYGRNDNFHPQNSHVIPALIQKFHEAKITSAKTVEIWGTGKPIREFLHVDDLAEAIIFILKNIDAKEIYRRGISCLNIGCGDEVSIKDLALLIKKITGFSGKLSFDKSKPDGTPRKLLDSKIIKSFGWDPKISLEKGLENLYSWYLRNL